MSGASIQTTLVYLRHLLNESLQLVPQLESRNRDLHRLFTTWISELGQTLSDLEERVDLEVFDTCDMQKMASLGLGVGVVREHMKLSVETPLGNRRAKHYRKAKERHTQFLAFLGAGMSVTEAREKTADLFDCDPRTVANASKQVESFEAQFIPAAWCDKRRAWIPRKSP